MTVSVAIPGPAKSGSAVRRQPRYISQNTNSLSISVNGATPVVANVSSSSPLCTTNATTSTRTCTISVSAPVGADTFAESMYQNTTGTGSPLSTNTTSATIVAGTANVVNITLDGVVAAIVLTLNPSNPPAGTSVSIPLTVNFNDASGAAIVGSDPFANPITLSDSDTSGATTLSTKTLNSPADASGVDVTYTGASNISAVIGASATGVPASAVQTATLTPQSTVNSGAFVDWPTYAYDTQRSGFNPYSTAITPSSISQLHLAWQIAVVNGSAPTQPIIATNVAGHSALLIVAGYSTVSAYDSLSGALVWQKTLPMQTVQDCGTGGVSGSVVFDRSLNALFLADGNGASPNHVVLYRLDPATGNVTGSVDTTPTVLTGEANYGHSGITLANGRIYLGTGSACEGTTGGVASWRGRVVSVDPVGMTLLSTFFTTYGQGGNYGGGGVWSWGGVSADPSGNIYVGTGNAESSDAISVPVTGPFVVAPSEQTGYSEQVVKLSSDLSTVLGSNYPGFNFTIGGGDLDFAGTPVIYEPPVTTGCGVVSATQGKGGTLVINSTQNNTPNLNVLKSYALSVPSGGALYVGNPAYSPNTDYLYAAITSAGAGSSMLPPGLAAISDCGSSMVWHTSFGPDSALYSGDHPRSAPTVTGGNVVFLGTPCTSNGQGGCGSPGTVVNGALWAVDGAAGTLLGGGKPVLVTTDGIKMAPSVDGQWVYVLDESGNLYGLTIDPNVKAITPQAGRRTTPTFRIRTK